MLLNCCVGEDSWESLGLQGDPTSQSYRKSVLNIHWKDWCWNWNSNTLATWCEELMHWERLLCQERLKMRGEGDDRGWDGCMASLTTWTWVWAGSGSWWWTGKPGLLQTMNCRLRLDWVTEQNWLICIIDALCCIGVQNWKTAIFQLELLIKISLYNLKIVIVWINH